LSDDHPSAAEAGSTQETTKFWTVPNILCAFRFVGSFALIPIALGNLPYWFVGTYLVLITTDLIDGPIARRLHQRSDLGAHLDSVADATLNACLVIGAAILCWDALQHELVFVGAVVASYLLSQAFGLAKFRKPISYHTYIAKTTQWLAVFAALALVLDGSVWPLRIATAVATAGNIETILITAALATWKTDVPTVFQVWRRR